MTEAIAAPITSSGLPQETKVVKLDLHSPQGRLKLAGYLDQGWITDTIEDTPPSRYSTVTLSRLKVSRSDRRLVANYSRGRS